MRKALLISLTLGLLFSTATAFAQQPPPAPSSAPSGPPEISVPIKTVPPEQSESTVKTIIWFVITFVSGFAFLICLAIVIMNAVKMMVYSGNPEKSQAAKAALTRALAGLVIIVLAGVALSTVIYVVTKPFGG